MKLHFSILFFILVTNSFLGAQVQTPIPYEDFLKNFIHQDVLDDKLGDFQTRYRSLHRQRLICHSSAQCISVEIPINLDEEEYSRDVRKVITIFEESLKDKNLYRHDYSWEDYIDDLYLKQDFRLFVLSDDCKKEEIIDDFLRSITNNLEMGFENSPVSATSYPKGGQKLNNFTRELSFTSAQYSSILNSAPQV